MYTVKFKKAGKIECYPYITSIKKSTISASMIECKSADYTYIIPISNVVVIIQTTK